MPSLTTRPDMVAEAILGYMGTHDVPRDPETLRVVLEDVYRLGCRDTLRQTAIFSQVTQTAQQSLVASQQAVAASQHILTLLRLISGDDVAATRTQAIALQIEDQCDADD